MTEFEQWWIFPEDQEIDLAIAPFPKLLRIMESKGQKIYYQSISESLIPGPQDVDALDALEEIVFIGYPSGIWDSSNNLPVVRRGTTATPIAINYENKKQFLIDASVFEGSSGSPVFLYDQGGTHRTKSGGTATGTRFFFLGVLSRGFYREDDGRIEMAPVPTALEPIAKTKQMINLGVVIKSQTVIELIDDQIRKGRIVTKPSTPKKLSP